MTAATKGPIDAPQSLIVRQRFLGMDLVDAANLDGVISALEEKAWRSEPDRLPVVVTPNVDIVVQLDDMDDPQIRNQFANGWCVLPDGQPIVTLAKMCGVSLTTRLAGSSLVDELWPRLAKAKERVLVIASNEESAIALRRENSEATVVVPPMFDGNDAEQIHAVVMNTLEAMGDRPADYVFIGIGFPKSSTLICSLLDGWPDQEKLPVLFGVGASFEMYLGQARRAPVWIQKIGMEWLFRFAQEPRRLFHRYFIRDSRFLLIAFRTLRSCRSASN